MAIGTRRKMVVSPVSLRRLVAFEVDAQKVECPPTIEAVPSGKVGTRSRDGDCHASSPNLRQHPCLVYLDLFHV